MSKILLIDDTPEELIYAQLDAVKTGFDKIVYATNLQEAFSYFDDVDCIASDLFFPAGGDSQAYIQRFLPLYESYKQKRFTEEKGMEVVRRAITVWAELFGEEHPTPEKGLEYFEKYSNNYDANGNPNVILRAARDAVHEVKDFEKYQKFLEIENNVRNGSNLPLGIIVSEEAQKRDIPCVIVTSTYHHDDAFEAVRNQLQASYVDTLVEGRKNWKEGLQRLLQ